MAKPPVTLRNIKGSPLSWAEGDANFTSLQQASVPDGGTTGQVLTKSSNTNYDYNWTSLQEINLQSVTSNLLPTTDLAYDLGSPTKRWRSLYVGLQTIYIDQYAISVSQGQLTIDGNTQIGPPGSQGTQGLQGTQGYQGIQGVQGTTGQQGVQGIQGTQGTQGVQGTTGSQGIQGTQGIQGVQGTIGAQGIQGVQGTIGVQGALGQQGLQGTVGDQGVQGVQGIQGTQGIQGVQGLDGTLGSQGIQGVQGLQGITGNQGIQGVQGTIGAQGVTGQQGIQGTTGYSSNLFFYKINAGATSGYPGDSNIIYNNATQVNSTQLLVSHLDDLSTDVDIYLSTISAGEQIIVQDRNASANYQNWLVTGAPTLTNAGQAQAYWTYPVTLASSGGTGTTGFANNHTVFLGLVSGAQGTQGLSGTTGAQGVQGVQGLDGTLGSQGVQGIQGTQGLQGQTGAQGATGAQGIQGTTGAQGTQGTTGISGASSLVFDYAIDTDTSTGDPGTGLISYNVVGGNVRTPVTITNQNSPVITSTSKFGTGSLNPSAGYIQTTPPSLNPTQNLTIEMWLYFTSGANQTFYNESTAYNQNCYTLATSNGNFVVDWGGNIRITGGGINLNQWTHLAVVANQSDNTTKLFINGVQVGNTFGAALNSIKLFQATIGSNFSGYIDEVRGSTSARYTSNFTPSTSAFTNDANTGLLLHFDGANGSSVFTDDAGSSQIDATELYINKTTANNQSATNYLALLASTSRFIIQDANNASNQQTWRITGTPTNNTNHYTIPVSIQSHSGTGTTNFSDALTVKLALQPSVQGIQGVSGSTGVQGTTGAQGTEGSAGSQGVQGIQGSTGTTGITGNQGIQGIQGIGEPGTQGTQGVQGATGAQGIQGIQGIQGTQGTTGTFDYSQADGGNAYTSFLVQANLNGGNAISN